MLGAKTRISRRYRFNRNLFYWQNYETAVLNPLLLSACLIFGNKLLAQAPADEAARLTALWIYLKEQ